VAEQSFWGQEVKGQGQHQTTFISENVSQPGASKGTTGYANYVTEILGDKNTKVWAGQHALKLAYRQL